MSFSDAAETALLQLIFNATTWANIADNAGTAPETALGVALHTTTGPGETGTQLTNEAAYGGYLRVDVTRNGSNWSVSGDAVTPVANIDFAEATSGSETETYFSIGKASNNDMLFYGTVTPNIVVTTGVTPRLTTATNVTLN